MILYLLFSLITALSGIIFSRICSDLGDPSSDSDDSQYLKMVYVSLSESGLTQILREDKGKEAAAIHRIPVF